MMFYVKCLKQRKRNNTFRTCFVVCFLTGAGGFFYFEKFFEKFFEKQRFWVCISYPFVQMSEVLQEAGGQLERSEIRDRISELDEHIAEFEQKLYTSNKTGNQYKKFDFKFNFAIKELSYAGLICHLPSAGA